LILGIAGYPRLQRDVRHLAVAVLSAVTLRILEKPLIEALAELAHRRRWMVLNRLRLTGWLELPAALVLMDYALYVWHVLTHRVPLLWRFYQVHHIDLDLSASTALRFILVR
jgi:sterol desaturase/sphingolipid hydroxylase (fatty acid hydroxylase superfamily)